MEYDDEESHENGRNDDEDDVNAANVVDNEYYNFLNVARDASEAEITLAYKRLTRLYHPDKHVDEAQKAKAEILFAKLNKVHAVLSDPHKRAIYDCLGKRGLAEPGWQLVEKRRKTPREIRDEFEELARLRAERRLEQRTNPTSKFKIGVNAVALFDDVDEDEDYDNHVEVTDIKLDQTIEFPMTNAQTVTLSGEAQVDGRKPRAGVGLSWRNVVSNRSWFRTAAGFEFADRPAHSVGATFYRRFTDRVFLTVESAVSRSPAPTGVGYFNFKPAFSTSFGNQFSKSTVGYLTYATDWKVAETQDAFDFREEQSGMTTMIVRTTPKHSFSFSMQLGIPYTYMSFSATRRFKEPKNKARAAFRFGTFGAVLEYGVEKKVSAHSTLGATMVVGVPVGVTLKLKLTRAKQTYLLPVHLTDEVVPTPVFYGTVTPLLVWFAVHKLVLEPLEARKHSADQEKRLRIARERIAEAKLEAEGAVSLMRERFLRIRGEAEKSDGLVIVVALYGRILDADGSIRQGLDVLDANSIDTNLEEVVDVTVAVQCLCEDASRIALFPGGSKAELPGFYDPLISSATAKNDEDQEDDREAEEEDKGEGESAKRLLVVYRYHSALHRVIVGDAEGVRLPRSAHRL